MYNVHEETNAKQMLAKQREHNWIGSLRISRNERNRQAKKKEKIQKKNYLIFVHFYFFVRNFLPILRFLWVSFLLFCVGWPIRSRSCTLNKKSSIFVRCAIVSFGCHRAVFSICFAKEEHDGIVSVICSKTKHWKMYRAMQRKNKCDRMPQP